MNLPMLLCCVMLWRDVIKRVEEDKRKSLEKESDAEMEAVSELPAEKKSQTNEISEKRTEEIPLLYGNLLLPSEYALTELEPNDENYAVEPKRYFLDNVEGKVKPMASKYAGGAIDFSDCQQIIDRFHSTLDQTQGLIEVNNGRTPHNRPYIYYITKEIYDSLYVDKDVHYATTYYLGLFIEMEEGVIQLLGSFPSVSGHLRLAREGYAGFAEFLKQHPDQGNHRVQEDPYDPNYGVYSIGLMNYGERPEYDANYPTDGLTLARKAVRFITENN